MANESGLISANIFEKCLPAISTDIARCGSVTLCNVGKATGDTLADIFSDDTGQWRNMLSLLVSDFEIKSCGAKVNGLYEFIMANKVNMGHKVNTRKLSGGVLAIEPFVMAAQKTIINNVYFTATNGQSNGGNWQIDVVSQTGIPLDVRWFPPGLRVFISGKTAGGTKTETAWKVISANVVSTVIRLVMSSENAGSFLADAKVTSPTTGVLRRGTVNVNDYEKFCDQIPGLNPNKDVPFFVETTRYTMCWDELYDKYQTLLRANNPMYAKYGDVEAVELNKQIGADFQRRFTEAFFFEKPISDNQTINNYTSLDQITTFASSPLYLPSSEGRCIGYRANATGAYEQLAQCGRVFDLQGKQLDLPELFGELYNIARVRDQNGEETQTIDLFMDSAFAGLFHRAMVSYYDDQSGGNFRMVLDLGQAKLGQNGPLGFRFNTYRLIWPQLNIAVITHNYFDDLVSAHTTVSTALTPVGRSIWVLDFAGIYPGIIESNRVVNNTGDLARLAEVDDSFACVMKNPTQKVTLNSVTYTVVVECPAASAIFENISFVVPEHKYSTPGQTQGVPGISGGTQDFYYP
jgi:hypothetical protein